MSTTKNVPEIRFNGFSGEWVKRELGAVAEIKTGPFGSTLHAKAYVEDGHAIITTEHFKSGELPVEKRGIPQVSDADYLRLQAYLLNVGDIVFSRVGSVDINAHVTDKQEGWLFSGRVLRVRSNNSIDSEYLHHELSTSRVKKSVVSRAVGQTMPSINTEILKITPIHFPVGTTEQTQIGKYFQKLDTLINQHQQKHDKLSNLKKAMLEKMFPKVGETVPEIRFDGFSGDWLDSSLLENIESIIDFRGRTPKKLGLDWSPSGYRALSALNVKQGYIDFSVDPHFGDQELYERWMTGSELHKGQVLFTTEAPMGNVAQVPDSDKYILSQRTIAFRVKSKVITEDFLAVLLRSPKVFRELSALASGGTAKGVSQKVLSKLTVQLPACLVEQSKIGNYFQKLDDLINQHQQQMTKIKNIKQACLDKMFV
ncbi:restriction endonuclease subunit S [Vibrio rotiferianus]|uniref:restriction endonuclease subunit S n=1 Tax=Vibrio rotiferianus TaxID=190895 RepID=UPI0005F09C55|nr:restriction endonuclease subunit S [Vibrio rotiferianus]